VPESPEGPPARDRRRADLRHAQSGDRRQDVRQGRGDVRGQDRRDAVGARPLLPPPASLYQGVARLDPEARGQGAALWHSGPAAGSLGPSARLQLSAPLPAGGGPLPDRGAVATRPEWRRHRAVLVAPRRGGRPAWIGPCSRCTISESTSLL